MTTDLATANMFLGIIAISSLVQMLAIGIACAGVFLVARRVALLIKTVEEQQLAPATERIRAILDDVKDVTSAVKTQASHLDTLAHWLSSALRRWGGVL